MNHNEYWKNLAERVYLQGETLSGDEEVLFRLSSIYGETMVDGIEAYFERRLGDVEKDMDVLVQCGFVDVASDFREAQKVMFGDGPLNKEEVAQVLSELLEEDDEVMPVLNQINTIYNRLIDRLESVGEYTHKFGIEKGLFQEDA
jgi:hypothetical protein